ncbi:hypothetical protein BDV33DRAFT_188456 [Aspergillus novoparasiticus]|uniref:Probable catabolite repression protein creC n=1 Tax=Aspergillus novoparasiticus TaxID=986946 RepID=A0A5N6F3G7_9EURO|nr:hypothetical protein BDV33DRAFT_188456 [Aspergillus novoparasiticus]
MAQGPSRASELHYYRALDHANAGFATGTYHLKDDLHLATPPPHPSEAPVVNPNPLATVPTPPTSGVKLSLVSVGQRNKLPVFTSKEKVTAPPFADGNPALAAIPTKDGLKRRKPKNNIIKSSSSFVSRVITHEASSKRLNDRNPDGLFAFANINRAFQWLDLSSKNKEEPLAKILFTKAHMLTHDINELTKSPSHIDIAMGSSAGDIIWYEPISQKYARINKNGVVSNSPVTHIKWIPGSENMFMAAHANGQLVVYDKEKEDALFTPEISNHSAEAMKASSRLPLQVLKSVNSRNQKTNPVALWKLANQKISQFAFSPDQRHLAVVLEDGSLRVMDYLKEDYYGGLICVCWSPDGKYIVTGGQDDLVTIWSFPERKIVARCQGHNSWVSTVAFDPWRCDERTYRFGSVGDDCRLLLWDFSVGMLHRPRAHQASARQRTSMIASNTQHFNRHRADSASNRMRSDSQRTADTYNDYDSAVRHPVEPRARTALLPPIMSKIVGDDPICWLGFQEDSIMTSSLEAAANTTEGHIRTWDRPREGINDSYNGNTSSPAISTSAAGSGSGIADSAMGSLYTHLNVTYSFFEYHLIVGSRKNKFVTYISQHLLEEWKVNLLCETRRLSKKCYYHPAPMTKPSKVSAGESNVATRGRINQDIDYSFSSDLTEAPTINCTYLGSTSFLSVFRETQPGLPPNPIPHAVLRGRWNHDHTFVASRLVQLLSAFELCEELLIGHYERCPVTIIPLQLILQPLKMARTYLETGGWARQFPDLRSPSSPWDFYTLFTGENLRWEFIGIIFSFAGLGALNGETKLFKINGQGPMSANAFAEEMTAASTMCVEICKQLDKVNDLMLWLHVIHGALASDIFGETSHRSYELLGDLVSHVYALGLHRFQSSDNDVPFFISETRKRLFVASFRWDKGLATLLELSLGRRTPDFTEKLRTTYEQCLHMWTQIPQEYHYSADTWGMLSPPSCVSLILVYFEYLYTVFQVERIRCRENQDATKDLLDTSMKVISVVNDLMKHREQAGNHIIKSFFCTLLFNAIPTAGALATEVHRCTVAEIPLPCSASRSEIIRKLSVFVSWLGSADPSISHTHRTCVDINKAITKLLDDTLNYRPSPRSAEHIPDPAQGHGSIEESSSEMPWANVEDLPDLATFGTSADFLSWLDDLGFETTLPELLV